MLIARGRAPRHALDGVPRPRTGPTEHGLNHLVFPVLGVFFWLQPRRVSPRTNGTSFSGIGGRHAKAFVGRHRGCDGDGGRVGRGGRSESSGLEGAAADSGVQLDRLVRRRACRRRVGREGVAGSGPFRRLHHLHIQRFDHQQLRRQRIPGRRADRYNYQSGPWVWGVEAQASWAGIRGSDACPFFLGKATCRTNVDALGSFAVRFGGTIDRALLYVKGGLAWAYERHRISSPAFFDGLGAFSIEDKHWRWGGMLGAGVEFAFTNTISGKLEYNYMDFGTRTYTFAFPGFGPFDPETADVKIRQSIHLVKVGLNFRFAFTNSISGKLEYNYMDFGTRTYSVVIPDAPPFLGETVDVQIRQSIPLVKVGLNFRWDSPVVARYLSAGINRAAHEPRRLASGALRHRPAGAAPPPRGMRRVTSSEWNESACGHG